MLTKVIKPVLLGGFRDMPPSEAIMFQHMIEIIRKVYESFGFVPLETPCMERWDVLTGGASNIEKSIFTSRIVRGAEDEKVTDETWDQDYTMRFDLTIPLARFVSANPNLPKPFKRYQIGRVWRGEKPQINIGRFREFYQFDFDIIGSNSIMADVEVIQVMYATMLALGIKNFVIRFNTRKLLNGLAELVNCQRANEMFRIIDKLDKIGLKEVLSQLQRRPDNEYDESALAFSVEQVVAVKSFLEIQNNISENNIVEELKKLFKGKSKVGEAGIQEIESIIALLHTLNIPEKNWCFDPSVARGLDYYTGPVFETVLTDVPKLGSVFSGGRFDGLADRFMPGSNVAGVGSSVGVSRLLAGMQELGLIKKRETLTNALVTVFDESNETLRNVSLACSNTLRKNGINTEIYFGEDRTLRAQFAYAQKKDIPFVIIIGEDELQQNKVQLKDMRKRKQKLLTIQECVDTILSSLE